MSTLTYCEKKSSYLSKSLTTKTKLLQHRCDIDLSAEDELITEQIFRDVAIHQGTQTPLPDDSVMLFFRKMSYQEIANKIDEPLSNCKIKLLLR
jgi:RNA polymerase sigma-70 factor (ECF subfamily)